MDILINKVLLIQLIFDWWNEVKIFTPLMAKVARVCNLVELERNNMHEKLDTCVADLESERTTIGRLRQEQTERMMENSSVAEGLRLEISRLENELRQAQWETMCNLYIYSLFFKFLIKLML